MSAAIPLKVLIDAEQALLAVKGLPAGKTIDLSLWDRVMCAQLALTRAIAPLVAVPVAIEQPVATGDAAGSYLRSAMPDSECAS